MAWTTPRTWTPGELVTATQFNAQIRDNLNVLKTNIGNDGSITGLSVNLLHQGSGTDTSAAATTVDSFTINGLTVKDTLAVYYNIESITQATANILLYQATDPLNLVSISGGASLAGGAILVGHAMLQVRRSSSVALQALSEGLNSSSLRVDAWNNPVMSTAWTGTWAMALRHSGVTAGGTFNFVWAVYKLAGQ